MTAHPGQLRYKIIELAKENRRLKEDNMKLKDYVSLTKENRRLRELYGELQDAERDMLETIENLQSENARLKKALDLGKLDR